MRSHRLKGLPQITPLKIMDIYVLIECVKDDSHCIIKFCLSMLLSSQKVFYVIKEVLNLTKHHWYHSLKFLIPTWDDQQATPLVGKCKRRFPQKITSSAQVIERNFTSIILLLLARPCIYRFILKRTNNVGLHPPINTISHDLFSSKQQSRATKAKDYSHSWIWDFK